MTISTIRQVLIFYLFIHLFIYFLLAITRSGNLAEIRWPVCISKSQRSLFPHSQSINERSRLKITWQQDNLTHSLVMQSIGWNRFFHEFPLLLLFENTFAAIPRIPARWPQLSPVCFTDLSVPFRRLDRCPTSDYKIAYFKMIFVIKKF